MSAFSDPKNIRRLLFSRSPNSQVSWSPWQAIRPFALPFAGASIAMMGRAAVLVLVPWPMKYIVDCVLMGRNPPHWMTRLIDHPLDHRVLLLNALVAAILFLGVADSGLDYLGNRVFLDAGQRVVFSVRRKLFAHLISLAPEFHRRRRAGELMTRLSEDAQSLQDHVAMFGTGVLPHGMTIAGMVAVMLVVNWHYALAVAAMAPLLVLISAHWSGLLRRNLRRVRGYDGELWSTAQEILHAVPLVQASGRQPSEEARFSDKAGESLSAGLHASLTQAQFPPLVNLVISGGGGLLTWYGAQLVIEGRISTGDLLVFMAYLRGLVTPARQIAKAAPVFSRTAIAIERLREMFAEQPAIADRPGAVMPAACRGELEFADVGFSYQPERAALCGVSLRLCPGRTVALVGPSGSGKSTIAALATRLLDPSSGAVRLDGQDLRDLKLAFVRRNVTLLAQEPLLLHGSVWENIAYGRPGAGRCDAMHAAEAAGVAEIIARLPRQFDEAVAERGASLSGGQRQCIAIARATLADSPVIILDEPTSSLDPLTEGVVMKAIARLTARRATLIIAHRLRTVRQADEIIVLRHGLVAERGTHGTLMQAGGLYAGLLAAQDAPRSAGHDAPGFAGVPGLAGAPA
jgi:ATP-binding cassette subfamily B protein